MKSNEKAVGGECGVGQGEHKRTYEWNTECEHSRDNLSNDEGRISRIGRSLYERRVVGSRPY